VYKTTGLPKDTTQYIKGRIVNNSRITRALTEYDTFLADITSHQDFLLLERRKIKK
jgi:hypothetical protein